MKPIVLCIMDGVGERAEAHGNAVKKANTPNLDFLKEKYGYSTLEASGTKVGLPSGQMGNSEVGHMNIGSGRIIYQPLELINHAIEEETFFNNLEILKVMNHVKKNNSKLHIMGLISDGGVHSHIQHLLALLDMCKKNEVENIYLHLCTDGRDVDPKSAFSYISIVQDKLKELGIGFSFIGHEVKIKIGKDKHSIDFLLFNYRFNCFVVVEVKVTSFKAEYIGQVLKYKNYVDENIKEI